VFVLANMVQAIAYVLDTFLWIYFWIIIARAVISWVNPDPWNPIVQFLYRTTEPILKPVRRLLPSTGGIDLSPILVLVGIQVARMVVVNSLYDLARSIRW
jgi:YggT family protein